MTTTKHTPTPWRVEGENIITIHEAQIGIAGTFHNIGQPAQANAAFIVQACNSYEALVEACKEFLRFANLPDIVNRGDYIRYQVKAIAGVESALALAGEKAEKG